MTINDLTAAVDNGVFLFWSDVSGADGYRIYRAQASGSSKSDYTQIADITSPGYTDTNVEDGEQYFYRVTSYTEGSNAFFEVTIDSTTSPVSPGDTLDVDTTVTNTGDKSGSQTVTLNINNSVGQVDSTTPSLNGGQSTGSTLSWSVPSGQTKQDYTATVASADDTASQTVTVGSAIPSSVVHHWKFDEGSGSTAGDSIGSADGAINGPTWVSGNYLGGYALDGDGTDDYVTVGTLGSYGSEMTNGFTWAFTVETSGTGKMIGTTINKQPTFTGFTNDWDPDNNSGRVQFSGSATNGVSTRQTQNNYNDGNKHRVVITTDGVTVGNLEIYVDSTLDVYTPRDEGDFSFADFGSDVHFFESTDPSAREPIDAVLDDIQFADSKWSSSEIQADYNRQPWT